MNTSAADSRSLNRWIAGAIISIVVMAATYSTIHFVVTPHVDAVEDEWRERSRLAGSMLRSVRNISSRIERYQERGDSQSLRRANDAVLSTRRGIDTLSKIFSDSREVSDSLQRMNLMLQTWEEAASVGPPDGSSPRTLSISPEVATPDVATAYSTLVTSIENLDDMVDAREDSLDWWEDAFYYVSLIVLLVGLLAILLILLRLKTALLARFRETSVQKERLESQASLLAAANERLTAAAQQAELSLREREVSEAFLKSAINSCDIGFGFLDKEMRFTVVNRVMADLHGVTAEDHVGRTPRELDLSIDDMSEPLIRRVLESGSSAEAIAFSATLATAPQAPREFTARHFPIRTESGELLGCGVAVADLTDQKELEEQLRQSQKMEAIGQLAGGIAHDFNNLLTVISGHMEMLLSDERPECEVADLRQVKHAAEQAAALTSKLLSFSRKQVMAPHIVELSAVVCEVEPMLRRLLPADVSLHVAANPACTRVRVDPVYIEQAVMNLVVNARDAMPQGGAITIETTTGTDPRYAHHVRQLGQRDGPFVVLSVRDTGTGMSEDVRGKAFQPFFTTKAVGKGTGLGLATVYGIVKQSGGHVVIESQLDIGTSVIIVLAGAGCADEARPVQVAQVANASGHETILLVDDNEGLLRLTARMLEGLSYTVLTAGNGKEALQLFQNRHTDIDLILSDVVMPELSGPALVRQLREQGYDVRAVLMSGHPGEEISQRGPEPENCALLGKPFSLKQLAAAVREGLDNRKPLAA